MNELRPYQIEDVQFLSQLNCAGCFNEQRTGKTPTALKTFETKNINKILIICPASAIYKWVEEYETWLNKPCIALDGTPKQRLKALENWTNGLAVSYDTFKTTKRSSGMKDAILALKPEGVIIDEAHRIKNTNSAACRAAYACTKIPNRLALTGTPAQNKQYDIYAILNWLFPNVFTSYWKFIHEYFQTIQLPNSRGTYYTDIRGFRPGKQKQFQQILASISTQRKRKEVMPWLPDKDYDKIKLPLTKEQEKYLNELEKYFETEHIITQGILDRLVRYRQICLHPGLLNLKSNSPKLEWIKQYLTDYPDTPTIIFSKFTSFIKILNKELPASIRKGVIIGETPKKERYELVNAFQNGELDLLILNIDAGKENLTLDRAETVIFTDKYPPAGDIQQAEDRFVSTTEDKANKPHKIIELMMKGTYDEKLYKLIEKNISETDVINDYKKYIERSRNNGTKS